MKHFGLVYAKLYTISSVLLIFFLVSSVVAEEVLRLDLSGENEGIIEIKLFSDLAPKHVQRIKLLTKEKKYDGVAFHRVIDGFMAQTGDVKFGNISNFDNTLVGMGGSEYPMLQEEFSDYPFEQGVVGMARSQDPDSANSQFFIMFEAAPHLNNKYTVVGIVSAGMDTALSIKKGKIDKNGSVEDPDFIKKASIIEVQF
jgi:cyclophilin family peptidyl-prolyl cis-trans isomerase